VTAAAATGGYPTVRSVGALLPADLLARVVAGTDLPGLSPDNYHLAGEPVRQAASRAFEYSRGVYARFRDELARRPGGDAGTGLTRERWLQPLLGALYYGRVPATPGGHLNVDGRDYPISHLWADVPVHLLGWGVDLDARTGRVAGAARAPQSMVQELLNRSPDHLWAVLSNGRTLRLLRDSSALVGQSYVEFDLETIFDGDLFSDFVLLFLLCHQSRLERLPGSDGQPGGVADRWLERWRTNAIDTGTRALTALRGQVTAALEVLGTGFLAHPANAELRDRLAADELRLADYNRALLRVVYRLLFWFVAEDRGALLDPAADPVAVDRYRRYFSADRLRRTARRRLGTRHVDGWARVRLVLDGLGREGGRPELGLPGLGGLFESGPLDVVDGAALTNETVSTVVRLLSTITTRGSVVLRTVDFRHLGADELGSIYESLLELHPRYDVSARTYTLAAAAGNERKSSGSYYTPSSLIDCLLDTALDPLLDDAMKAADGPAAEAGLLAMTVCDPAMGSGAFLVAAARRIARRLAEVRAGDPEPPPPVVQAALRDVVARCIHGVDLNPMAVELAKVSLWLEGLEPGRPLAFLDANLRPGNALLGTTPALLAAGVPEAALKPLAGDDRKVAALLARRNRNERIGADDLFTDAGIPVGNTDLASAIGAIRDTPAGSLADVHVARRRYRELAESPARRQAQMVADAWCTAFVQEKSAETVASAVTDAVLRRLAADPVGAPNGTVELVRAAARRYRFFHWHLEFPHIFRVPADGPAGTDTGWEGGFACVVGNPPWDAVQMSEKEYFAERDPDIATAPNAAARKKLIARLPDTNPNLFRSFSDEARRLEGDNHLVRESGRFPLTARGKINTYSIFAETMRAIVSDAGRAGVITPTGLATDATTAPFFADTVATKRLAAFYDFENEAKIFAGVHNQFRFGLTSITGRGAGVREVSFAFYTRFVADVSTRRFLLAPEEVLLLNPNTGTLPLFRSRLDADVTLGVYRRLPVLVRDGAEGSNPWLLTFRQGLFNMASDSGAFRT
jgi:N-6 DNA Methylase